MKTKEKENFSAIQKAARTMGRMGGKVGGKRSLETLTPEQRTARAKKAAAASAAVRSAKAKARKADPTAPEIS